MNTRQCFYIDELLDCVKYDNDKLQQGIMSCNICKDGIVPFALNDH